MLADGRLHLTGLVKLAPHLTPENRDDLLKRAAHRTRRQIEELVAEVDFGRVTMASHRRSKALSPSPGVPT